MTKTLPKILLSQLAVAALLCSPSLAQAGSPQPATTGSSPAQAGPLTGVALDHVTFSVEDMDKMSDWYAKVLGFTVAKTDKMGPNMSGEVLRNGSYRIDLIKYKGSARPPVPKPIFMQQGLIHIALTVPDLPAALATLKALNTDVTGNANGRGGPLVLHDPEGNEIEIMAKQ